MRDAHPRLAQVSGDPMTEPPGSRSDRASRTTVRVARGVRLRASQHRATASPRRHPPSHRPSMTKSARVRETMAVVSAATAVEAAGPSCGTGLLTEVSADPVRALRPGGSSVGRPQCWRPAARVGDRVSARWVSGWPTAALRPSPSTARAGVRRPRTWRTVSGPIPSGGTATVVFSREKNAGVLVMNNVAPPAPGTVYQMWLIGDKDRKSARDDGCQGRSRRRPPRCCPISATRRRWRSPSNPPVVPAQPHQPALRQAAVGFKTGSPRPNSADDVFHVVPSAARARRWSHRARWPCSGDPGQFRPWAMS